MDNIIDLTERRSASEKPDAEWVRYDDYGRPMYHYGLSYAFEGGSWAADIWAYSMEDAQARVDAMRKSLVLLGQTYSVVPA
jgi:hypothetical protein